MESTYSCAFHGGCYFDHLLTSALKLLSLYSPEKIIGTANFLADLFKGTDRCYVFGILNADCFVWMRSLYTQYQVTWIPDWKSKCNFYFRLSVGVSGSWRGAVSEGVGTDPLYSIQPGAVSLFEGVGDIYSIWVKQIFTYEFKKLRVWDVTKIPGNEKTFR